MGVLTNVGQWVTKNLPTVVSFVKKVAKFTVEAKAVVDVLLEGRKIVLQEGKDAIKKNGKIKDDRLNILSSKPKSNNEISLLVKSINENKKTLQTVRQCNEVDHNRIGLQIDVMELIVSAQTFERFTNNISLHAANLQIHLRTIQNMVGVLDAVNRQRTGVKALMKTVNHLINVLGVEDKVDRIDGVDVNMRPGSISIFEAYEAFENTRNILIEEIILFAGATDLQLQRVEDVRCAAQKLPEISSKVSSWLGTSVEPKLMAAKKQAESLRGELVMIPKLEMSLRRVLECPKEDDL
jgi:hypothetical protein